MKRWQQSFDFKTMDWESLEGSGRNFLVKRKSCEADSRDERQAHKYL
jgi:hypothetical protein